jgi:hypothetical protein
MIRSPLFGRRIHISGSVAADLHNATARDVDEARELVDGLVRALVKKGANFVVPVDAEPVRPDGRAICFDWLVWKALSESMASRPPDVPGPLAVAVQHHKNEDQIPEDMIPLWDAMRESPNVRIESAAHWNMASKRMEAQARFGDILVALGGTEGVLFLGNLYHEAGKPVVPLGLPITGEGQGARKLYDYGLVSAQSPRLFRTRGGNPHDWINRIRHRSRQTVLDRVRELVDLLEALAPPRAFAVRLLDPKHVDYASVQDHFDMVVQPIIEGELGYELTVVDGRQSYEYSRIDAEIFAKLHRSGVVLADITGARPNCFIELGYAFGRQIPTMVMGKAGGDLPFDIKTFSGLHWEATGTAADRRRVFREHWQAISGRPPLVSAEPLIP